MKSLIIAALIVLIQIQVISTIQKDAPNSSTSQGFAELDERYSQDQTKQTQRLKKASSKLVILAQKETEQQLLQDVSKKEGVLEDLLKSTPKKKVSKPKSKPKNPTTTWGKMKKNPQKAIQMIDSHQYKEMKPILNDLKKHSKKYIEEKYSKPLKRLHGEQHLKMGLQAEYLRKSKNDKMNFKKNTEDLEKQNKKIKKKMKNISKTVKHENSPKPVNLKTGQNSQLTLLKNLDKEKSKIDSMLNKGVKSGNTVKTNKSAEHDLKIKINKHKTGLSKEQEKAKKMMNKPDNLKKEQKKAKNFINSTKKEKKKVSTPAPPKLHGKALQTEKKALTKEKEKDLKMQKTLLHERHNPKTKQTNGIQELEKESTKIVKKDSGKLKGKNVSPAQAVNQLAKQKENLKKIQKKAKRIEKNKENKLKPAAKKAHGLDKEDIKAKKNDEARFKKAQRKD